MKYYSIGQVAEMFDLRISTLRYYDKEGLFPNLLRNGSVRKFSDYELDALRVIDCLKRSGMEIKEIKLFMDWVKQGPETAPQRKELFETRRSILLAEMQELQRHLAMLNFKCWYYDQLVADPRNEEKIKAMLPDNLPPEAQAFYDLAHSDVLKAKQVKK